MTEQTSNTGRASEAEEVERLILIESLSFIYRSMSSAAIGHVVAALFIVVALYKVEELSALLIWLSAVIVISLVRYFTCRQVSKHLQVRDMPAIKRWANVISFLAFIQTSIWGSSVFFIWPEEVAYRAVLVTILAGVIAAGGIMLALHRRSFLIYSLPITIPAVIQLSLSGGELEWILAALLVFYSVLLYFAVSRLTNVFVEGLRNRFMMQTESRTDALTSLANRRGFDESINDLWQQSIRSGQSIGLLILDVDYFKLYNDYYGHPQGDVALKKLGSILADVASRSTDLCARIGGEEFAVLLPATELEGTLQVARGIQDALAVARIPHRNCERGVMTVSIGLNVVRPSRQTTMNHFFLEADQALYEAKESGRNLICIAKSIDNKKKEESGSTDT